MTDNLANLFANEPPDSTALVAWRDGVPEVLQRDDGAADEVGAGVGEHWWSTSKVKPMTLQVALDGAERVDAVVPLEQSRLVVAEQVADTHVAVPVEQWRQMCELRDKVKLWRADLNACGWTSEEASDNTRAVIAAVDALDEDDPQAEADGA